MPIGVSKCRYRGEIVGIAVLVINEKKHRLFIKCNNLAIESESLNFNHQYKITFLNNL